MKKTAIIFIALWLSICLAAVVAPVEATAHPFDQTYASAVEALDAYRALVKDYPDDLDLHYLLGSMLIMANKLDEAESTFQFVLDKDPSYDMAWYKLSEVYYRRGQYEKAIKTVENMKDETLQDDKLIAQATMYLKLEQPEKALEVSKKAVEIDDLNPGGWLHMGLAEYKLGHFEKGIKLLRTSLEMDPGQPLVYDWYFDFISKHRTPEQQLQILKDLYKSIPYDSPTAQKITVDIYQIKRKLGIVEDEWDADK